MQLRPPVRRLLPHSRPRARRPGAATPRRNYDLYLEKRQFASIRGGLLAWEFELQDEAGRPMAKVDRNFSGFGVELFTDAGERLDVELRDRKRLC